MSNKFFQKSFKFTVLISAFLCLLQSPELYAQNAPVAPQKLDAVVFIPSVVWINQLKTQIQNTKVDLAQQVDNYSYANADASIKFVSERVNFDTRFTSQRISNITDGLQLNFELNQAAIQISNFNLVALIQKDLGFGTATLKLDMHCDVITLNLKNMNPVATQLKVENGKFVLSQLNWDLKNTEIQTQLTGCKEIAGFDELLKQQIQQNLEQAFVLESLQKMINERLNSRVNEKIENELNNYIQKFIVGITVQHQIDNKNNLWVYSAVSPDQVFTGSEIQQIENSTKVAILIKKKNLESFVKDSLNDILKANTLSSNSFDDMKKLTCSRLIQFFIWPALKSLSKCFEMKIQTQIQNVSITDLKSVSLGFTLGAWASGESHQIAYFESALSAQLMQTSVQMKSFKGQSNPDFINWSGRSKRISTSMIRPALQKLLDSTFSKLKENNVFKLIQQKTNLKPLSADTLLIEVNI